jgi:hypothetical protein
MRAKKATLLILRQDWPKRKAAISKIALSIGDKKPSYTDLTERGLQSYEKEYSSEVSK